MALRTDKNSGRNHDHALSQVDSSQAADAQRFASIEAKIKTVEASVALLGSRVSALEESTPEPGPEPEPPPIPGPEPTGVTPPSAIDRTGATDVTTALVGWLNGLPAGTMVNWDNGTYKVRQIVLEGKSLRFSGTGKLNFTTVLSGSTAGAIHLRANCHDMEFGPGLVMTGAVPSSDWGRGHTSQEAGESNHAFALQGVQGIKIDGVIAQGFGGDGVYSGGFVTKTWTHGLTLRNSTFTGCGRMGVGVADGLSNAVIEGCTFDKFGWYPCLDIEPNGVAVGSPLGAAGFTNIVFRNNKIGRGNSAKLTFVVSTASNEHQAEPVVSGIVATGNRTMYTDTPWNTSISGWSGAVTMSDNR